MLTTPGGSQMRSQIVEHTNHLTEKTAKDEETKRVGAVLRGRPTLAVAGSSGVNPIFYKGGILREVVDTESPRKYPESRAVNRTSHHTSQGASREGETAGSQPTVHIGENILVAKLQTVLTGGAPHRPRV